LIQEGQRVNVCETAEVTGIAKCTVHKIISDLNFHKVVASLESLCCYQDEGESFIESIITGNVTCVYKFIPESKINS
jgi:hypothetical protein